MMRTVLVLTVVLTQAVAAGAGSTPPDDMRAKRSEIDAALGDPRTGAYRRSQLFRDRGLLEFQSGRPLAAVRDFDRSIDIDPGACPSALRLRGLASFAAGRCDEARLDFDACGAFGGDFAGSGRRRTELPSDWHFAPRLWSYLAMLRSGGRHEGNILADYLEALSCPPDPEEPSEAREIGGECCGCLVVEDDRCAPATPAERCMDVIHGRRLALLFLGRCEVDEYHAAVEGALRAVAQDGDRDDTLEAAQRRIDIRRLDATRSFYLGQYWLMKGKARQAETWLSRAADYDGPVDSEWPLVGRGGLAALELARLRSAAAPAQGDAGLAAR